MTTFWITRPRQSGLKTQAKLERLGYDALLDPVIEIQEKSVAPIDKTYQGIILTSQNAVFALKELQSPTPILTVGDETANAVIAQFPTHPVQSAGGTSDDLIKLIQKTGDPKSLPFLYLRGVDIHRPLKADLNAMGFTLDEAIVYEAQEQSIHPDNFQKVQGILVYSARTAQVLSDLINAYSLQDTLGNTDIFCISHGTSKPLLSYNWKGVHVPHHPTEEQLIQLIKDRYDRQFKLQERA